MGLGDLEFSTPRLESVEFEKFIRSDSYRSLVVKHRASGEEPSCLLDIVLLWVRHTDALLHYPTYKTFLYCIFELTNSWLLEGGDQLSGEYLWPLIDHEHDEPTAGLPVKLLSYEGVNDGEPYGMEVMSHPVMREENFLLLRSRLQRGESPRPVHR